MKIELQLENYNIEKAIVTLITKVSNDYPTYTREQLSNELGISIRTLYRYIKKHDIVLTKEKSSPTVINDNNIEELPLITKNDLKSIGDKFRKFLGKAL